MTQPATAIKLQEPSVQMQPNFFEEPNRHQRFCFLFQPMSNKTPVCKLAAKFEAVADFLAEYSNLAIHDHH